MRGNQKCAQWAKVLGFALIFISILLIGIFLLRGKTIVVSNGPSVEKIHSLNCGSDTIKYPFFSIPDSSDSNMTINLVFDENHISSVSLIYKIYYSDAGKALSSSSHIHAIMNESFGVKLGADALNANYTAADNMFRLSLYANETELNEYTRKYFMINDISSALENYKNNYESQGFICTQKDEENNQ